MNNDLNKISPNLEDKARSEARQLHQTTMQLSVLNNNPVAFRIAQMAGKMHADMQEAKGKALQEEVNRAQRTFNEVAVELVEQNKRLIRLLEQCAQYITAKDEADGVESPACAQEALVFLTELQLLGVKYRE